MKNCGFLSQLSLSLLKKSHQTPISYKLSISKARPRDNPIASNSPQHPKRGTQKTLQPTRPELITLQLTAALKSLGCVTNGMHISHSVSPNTTVQFFRRLQKTWLS